MEIKIIKISDRNYPQSLKNIFDPSERLYVFGELPKGKMVAVVGNRIMTNHGQKATENIVAGLIKDNYVVVSGMALGVDAVAHWTAIKRGGKTVAVLGAGPDIIYPPQNRELYFKIINSGGAIISEIPPGNFVPRGKFPARNRIISGLSEAVIVVEAQLRSGALITARLALDQGRDVYAVPGSPGCDYLLDCGANVFLPS